MKASESEREALISEKKILEISAGNIILNEKKRNSHFDAYVARMPAAEISVPDEF